MLTYEIFGVPVSIYATFKAYDWDFLEGKMVKKVDAWKGNASFGGRFILVSASLSAVPSFVMSMFLFNKTILGRLDKRRRRFFWHTGSLKKKNHMVKRKVICRSKNKGGLGVLDLGKQYITFLTK